MNDAGDETMRASMSALHEMNPTTRFGDRVSDYARFRPSYPAAAVEFVLAGLPEVIGVMDRSVVADVGAGTGIFARLLADRGARVIAIEPNASMRVSASAHDRIEWRDRTAEATGLASASVDVVTCAQAFHWFRAGDALAEFRRILRGPIGRVALVWNERDERDDLTREYSEAIREASKGHPAERMPFEPRVVEECGLFSAIERREFAHEHRLTSEGLIGRALSASYAPKQGAAHERMTRRLGEAFDRFATGAEVAMKYLTRVHRFEARPT